MSSPRSDVRLLAVLALLAGCTTPGGPDVTTVQVIGRGFEPATLTVAPGTEIRWNNQDPVAHTVTTDEEVIAGESAVPPDAEPWDSGPVREGQTFSQRLDVEGSYTYWCTRHRDEQMVGTIRVEAP